MNRSGLVRRGQPLLFLAALLALWLGVRTALWEPPFALGDAVRGLREGATTLPGAGAMRGVLDESTGVGGAVVGGAVPVGHEMRDIVRAAGERWRAPVRPLPGLIPVPLEPVARSPLEGGAPWREERGGRVAADAGPDADGASASAGRPVASLAVGHALLAMMGLSQMQLPPALASLIGNRRRSGDVRGGGLARAGQAAEPPAPALRASPVPGARRWSADGWLFLREGDLRSPVPGQPSYGRSQAGAVLRYRLAPSSARAPEVYARLSSALRSPRDAELAAGLSVRPLAILPLRLAGELRLADRPGGAELRPAAYAVTELAPIDLPFASRAEFYAQGGYVGGDFATAFVDGQVRVTREVVRAGRTALAAGAGAWGGAQKGAARLDVGPSASVSFSIGQVYSRLSVDYRVRVAGDAEPESGPALTLSAGF